MYSVSALYNTIIAKDEHWFQTKVEINSVVYGEDSLMSVRAAYRVFGDEQPVVGGCLSAELEVKMLTPNVLIPRMAEVKPYIRVTDGTDTSEWIPQGVFYIDTREESHNDNGLSTIKLHCYDAMLRSEADYPNTDHDWPEEGVPDWEVVDEIASTMGVSVDSRTYALMNKAYPIGLPAGYSMREVLGNIAAMYAGNWIMNFDGELRLVTLTELPDETNYLVDSLYEPITFGEEQTEHEVTGAIVSFEGDGSVAQSVVAEINPVQNLNGYSAPWPPGGGKNKFAIRNGSATVGGGTVTFSDDGTVSFAGVSPTANSVATMHGSNTEANKMTLPPGSYIVSCEEFGDANCYVGININSTSGAYAATSRGSGAFTVQAGDYVYPRLRVGAGATVDNVTIHPMIRLASVADDTWEPYYNICPIGGYDDVDVFVEDEYDAGATPAETVSLGSTYYSGMLDVTSGVLTANMIGLVFDGTEDGWISSGTAPKRFFRYVYSGAKSNTYAARKCSHYPNADIYSSNTDVGYYAYTSTSAPNDVWLNFRPDLDAIPDMTAWKAFLAAQYSAGTPVQAIFQIDTPQTVQLSETEVYTLLGQNNMWADSGNITVDYTYGDEVVRILV